MKYYKISGSGPCGYTDYQYRKVLYCPVDSYNDNAGYCRRQIEQDIARYVRTMPKEKMESYGYCSREIMFYHIYDNCSIWETQITEERFKLETGRGE